MSKKLSVFWANINGPKETSLEVNDAIIRAKKGRSDIIGKGARGKLQIAAIHRGVVTHYINERKICVRNRARLTVFVSDALAHN